MIKTLLALYFSLVCLVSLAATSGPGPKKLIYGRVVDKQTGDALAGVKLIVKGTDIICYTNFDGNYTLYLDPKSTKEIELIMLGYASLTINVSGASLEHELILISR